MNHELNKRRQVLMYTLFGLVGIVFITKLFLMQVVDDRYRLSADENAILKMTIHPHRGLIYDRNGRLMVYNEPVYDLMVIPREAKLKDTASFCRLVGISPQELVARIKKIKSSGSEGILIPQISKEDFTHIQDYLHEYEGFYISRRTIRRYSNASSMGNILGYIAEISPTTLTKDTGGYYKAGDYIGTTGIEATYEPYLRGEKGVQYVLKDRLNRKVGSYQNGKLDQQAVAGQELKSSIDLELQLYGEKLMQNKVGSVVAIEPATGEILTIISAPSYDPNLLTGQAFGRNYVSLKKDPDNLLFNRAVQSRYPPGSTFKTAHALIALQDGVINDTMLLPCNQALVKCHAHVHYTNVRTSIQYSCNPFYYTAFRKIVCQHGDDFKNLSKGYTDWRKKALKLGFGRKLGVDIADEGTGSIPLVDRFNRVYGEGNWNYSNIYSLSIGQGEMGVTPLQMANWASIIANRGHYYVPHIIKSVGNTGKPLPLYQKPIETGFQEEYFEMIIDGMEGAFKAGTVGIYAQQVKSKDIVICAKTGTVQNPHGEDHSTFIAFAPRENPKIAIAVYVENAGFGGIWAGTIATLMIEKYLGDTTKHTSYQKTQIASIEQMTVSKVFNQRELLRQDSIFRVEKRRLDSLKAIEKRKEEELELKTKKKTPKVIAPVIIPKDPVI